MKVTLRNYILPLIAVVIWSGNTVVSKMAASAVDPATISFYRWLFAAVCLTPFVWREWSAKRAVIRRHWPQLAVMGLLGMVLFQCLAYIAAHTTTATNMGLIFAVMPLLTVVLSVWWLAERPTRGDVAGGVISIVGLIYLLSQGHPASLLAHGVTVGDGIMLLATVAYAAYTVLLKRWHIDLSRWGSLSLQMWFAVAVLLIWYLAAGAPAVTRAALPLMLYAGVLASLIAPGLWLLSIHTLGPQRSSALMNLTPVITVVIAYLLLGEALHSYHLLGGGLVLVGVIVVQKWTQPLRA